MTLHSSVYSHWDCLSKPVAPVSLGAEPRSGVHTVTGATGATATVFLATPVLLYSPRKHVVSAVIADVQCANTAPRFHTLYTIFLENTAFQL